jgi:hypothetical protein
MPRRAVKIVEEHRDFAEIRMRESVVRIDLQGLLRRLAGARESLRTRCQAAGYLIDEVNR